MIEQLYERVPGALKNQSGAVFNSGRTAFSNPCQLYLLGLNPGGDPDKHKTETVDFHTRKVLSKPNDWSEFRDESWDRREPGARGMQPRILHMLKGLNLDAHRVPASNVVFKRTSSEKELSGDFNKLAEQCWSFHQHVIERLKVRVILCFGKTASELVRSKVGADKPVDRFVEANNRRWSCQTFSNSQGLIVVAATHPSRVAWNTQASDPTGLIRRALQQ